MTIKTIKTDEKLTLELKPASARIQARRFQVTIRLWPQQKELGILLIIIGLLGLTVQAGVVDSQILSYWWLIFLTVPLVQKRRFGWSKRHVTSEGVGSFSAEKPLP